MPSQTTILFHIESDDRCTNGEILFTGTLEECRSLCKQRLFNHPLFGGITADIISNEEATQRNLLSIKSKDTL